MSKEKAVFVAARPLVNGWGQLEEHSNGGLYVGIVNGDAGIGTENSANALDWRAFDRSVFASPQTPSNIPFQAHWFQRNQIQSITFGGAFVSVHTCTGMENRLDFGVHTGLYSVTDQQGRLYLCGMYPGANASEMGWVKQDTVTGVWTSGIVTGVTKAAGNRMSPCVAYEGLLVHSTNGVVTFFNPVDDSMFQFSYAFPGFSSGSIADRPIISSGILFIVHVGNTDIYVTGSNFGAFNTHLPVASYSFSIANGGGFGLLRFGNTDDHNTFYVFAYTTVGGTGTRCSKITTGPGALLGFASTQFRDSLPPTAAPLTHLGGTWPYVPQSFENLQWPGGTAHPNYSWESCFDNVDTPPYAPASANNPWGHCKLVRYPYTSLVPGFTYGGVQFFFNGDLAPLSDAGATGSPPGGFTGIELLGELSISSQWNGGDDTRNNAGRPKWWPISATNYSDGTTPRGMLINFWGQSGGSTGVSHVLVLYGRLGQRPNLVATLVAGSPAVAPGGTGSFNGTFNRIENCDPADSNFSTLEHDAVVGGPFNVGATIQGGTSGATAVVNFESTFGAYVSGIAGGPFTVAETITQTNGANVGANATLLAQEDAVTHSAVWDLDADGVPDEEFVTIQPLAGPAVSSATPNPTAEDVTYSGYTLTVLTGSVPAPDTPNDSDGPVVGTLTETQGGNNNSDGLVVGTLTETQGGNTDSDGPVVGTLTEGPSPDSDGPVVDVTAQGDYPPSIQAQAPGRAHSQPGWINLQVDGVDQGGDQGTLNWDSSTTTIPVGGQDGTVPAHKAELEFRLGSAVAKQPGTLATLGGVDLSTVAETAIYTVPAGKTAVIFGASVRGETGTVVAPATAGLGFNGSADNLFSSQLLVGLNAVDDAYDFPIGGESVIASAGSVISLGVDGGADAAQTGEVILFGYLL